MYSVKKDTYFQIHGFDGLEIVTKNLITLLDIWKCQPTFKIHINPIPIEWYQENLSEEYPSVQNDYAKFFQTINFPFERKIGALKFHNYGNGRSFRDKNKNTCSIVKGRRHRILQITYDCKVIPCCFDYNAAVVWGNLQENSLRDIFNDVSYLNFIKKHHEHKEECFSICKNCDTKE
jgi:hypothetical protein